MVLPQAANAQRAPASPASSNRDTFGCLSIFILCLMAFNLLLTVQWSPAGETSSSPQVRSAAETPSVNYSEVKRLREEELMNLPTEWRDYVVETSSKAWENKITGDSEHSWCVPGKPPDRDAEWKPVPQQGILFVRPFKARETFAAGATLRIAHQVAARSKGSTEQPCLHWWEHQRGAEGFWKRDPTKSILWTAVRNPRERALSEYLHYNVARNGEENTDAHAVEVLEELKSSQMLHIMHRSDYEKEEIISFLDNPTRFLRAQVFDFFDFVAVAERMEESLVAFKILYDLDHWDIVVLNSDREGEYDDGPPPAYKCVVVPKVEPTEAVGEYLSKNFTEDNLDYLLYDAAVKSLDKTIEAIGKEKFQKDLNKHRLLRKIVEKECRDQAVFACSKEGEMQRKKSLEDCYEPDLGCGKKCIDDVMSRYKQGLIPDPE